MLRAALCLMRAGPGVSHPRTPVEYLWNNETHTALSLFFKYSNPTPQREPTP